MALSSITEHWIRQDALTITLNVLGPDIIQASVLSGTAIAAYKNGVIGYDTGHNFRTWPVLAYATALEYTGPNYVYAKLTRSEKSPKALISYSKDEIDIEGRRTLEDGSYSEIDAEYFYIYLGKISSSVDESGNQVDRYWIDSFRFGTLGTNQFQMEESEADWTRMFRLNKVSDVIEVLKNIVSATIQKLTVVTHLIIGGKTLTDVATSSDTEQFKKPSDTHIATPGYVDSYSESTRMSKLHDDTVQGNIEFAKEVKIGEELTVDGKSHFNGDVNVKGDTYFGEYIQSATGACIKKGEDGNWLVETDHLLVRKKATFTTVEIQDVRHVGGQILLSAAEAVVEYVEKTSIGWKCYFRATDGEKTITNDWVVGDQAYCNVFNLEGGSHYLWRRVESKGKGEGVATLNGQPIDLSEYYYTELSENNAAFGSDEPQVGDHLVQLGHQGTDEDRQNAIIIAGAGEGSPYIYQFVGIDSFTLPEPETRIKPRDNFFTGQFVISGDGNYSGDVGKLLQRVDEDAQRKAGEVENFAKEAIKGVQDQIDGAIDTWFYDGVPTLDNKPASDWVTDKDKNIHLGDLYYDGLTGKSYRFQQKDGVYSWVEIVDTELSAAMKKAQDAYDLADGKRTVYVSQPTAPYKIGDLWSRKDEPLMVCIRDNEASFSLSDWDYADNSKAYADAVRRDITNSLSISTDALKSSIQNLETTSKQYADAKKEEAKQYTDAEAKKLQDSIKALEEASTSLEEFNKFVSETEETTEEQHKAIEAANVLAQELADAAQRNAEANAKSYADGEIDATEKAILAQSAKDLADAQAAFNAALANLRKEFDDKYALLSEDVKALGGDLNAVKGQADQKFEIYFGEYVPFPNRLMKDVNYPASEWVTEAAKALHVQDLFYDTSIEPASEGGRAWRWIEVETDGVKEYYWEIAQDQDTIQALEKIVVISKDTQKALETLNEYASDEMLVAVEKKAILREWNEIHEEKAQLIATSENNGIDTSDYKKQYNLLSNYLDDPTKMLSNKQDYDANHTVDGVVIPPAALTTEETTKGINRNAFNGRFSDFYNARNELRTKLPALKTQTFISDTLPEPPYQKGDIWMRGNTVYYCVTSKAKDEESALTDWVKAEQREPKVIMDTFAELWYKRFHGLGENPQAEYYVFVGEKGELYYGDIWYDTTTGKIYDYNNDEVVDEALSGALHDVSMFIGNGAYPIYIRNKRPTEAAPYSLLFEAFTLSYTNGDGETVETSAKGVQISWWHNGTWESLREQTKSLFEVMGDAIVGIVGDVNAQSGVVVENDFVEIFSKHVGEEEMKASIIAGVTDENGQLSTEIKVSADKVVLTSTSPIASAIQKTNEKTVEGLKSTGIEIDKKEITLTAGKVNFRHNDGSVNENIEIDTETGTLKAKNGEFSGKVTATSGEVGGFDIDEDSISANASTLNLGVDSFKVRFKATSETGKQVTLIQSETTFSPNNVNFSYNENRRVTIPSPMGYNFNKAHIVDFLDIDYHNNRGLTTISGEYGYQYASLGNGHICLDGMVEGHCLSVIDTYSESYQVQVITPPFHCNRILVKTRYDHCVLVLPHLTNMLAMLGHGFARGEDARKAFSYRFTIMSTDIAIRIAGRNNGTVNNSQPFDNENFPAVYINGSLKNSLTDTYVLDPTYRALELMLVYDGTNYFAMNIQ